MKKRLKNYLHFLEDLEINNMTQEHKESLRGEMLIQIGFFQHERLTHLIVTITIAILAFLSLLGGLVLSVTALFLLTGLLVMLLIPYVFHYFTLENGVQKLYEYYDKTLSKN